MINIYQLFHLPSMVIGDSVRWAGPMCFDYVMSVL